MFKQGPIQLDMTIFIEKDSPIREPVDRLRVEPVFLFQNPRCQAVGSVILADRYTGLHQHRTAIRIFGYKVHACANFPVAGIKCALVGIQSGEVWQQ